MKKKTKTKKPPKISKLPTFKVPPGTPMIPWDLAQKFWEEEGLEDMETVLRLRG
jgi:hypothetical protein